MALDDDWGVGVGGSAQNTCNCRIKFEHLNKVLERYFDNTVEFNSLEETTEHAVDGYYY